MAAPENGTHEYISRITPRGERMKHEFSKNRNKTISIPILTLPKGTLVFSGFQTRNSSMTEVRNDFMNHFIRSTRTVKHSSLVRVDIRDLPSSALQQWCRSNRGTKCFERPSGSQEPNFDFSFIKLDRDRRGNYLLFRIELSRPAEFQQYYAYPVRGHTEIYTDKDGGRNICGRNGHRDFQPNGINHSRCNDRRRHNISPPIKGPDPKKIRGDRDIVFQQGSSRTTLLQAAQISRVHHSFRQYKCGMAPQNGYNNQAFFHPTPFFANGVNGYRYNSQGAWVLKSDLRLAILFSNEFNPSAENLPRSLLRNNTYAASRRPAGSRGPPGMIHGSGGDTVDFPVNSCGMIKPSDDDRDYTNSGGHKHYFKKPAFLGTSDFDTCLSPQWMYDNNISGYITQASADSIGTLSFGYLENQGGTANWTHPVTNQKRRAGYLNKRNRFISTTIQGGLQNTRINAFGYRRNRDFVDLYKQFSTFDIQSWHGDGSINCGIPEIVLFSGSWKYIKNQQVTGERHVHRIPQRPRVNIRNIRYRQNNRNINITAIENVDRHNYKSQIRDKATSDFRADNIHDYLSRDSDDNHNCFSFPTIIPKNFESDSSQNTSRSYIRFPTKARILRDYQSYYPCFVATSSMNPMDRPWCMRDSNNNWYSPNNGSVSNDGIDEEVNYIINKIFHTLKRDKQLGYDNKTGFFVIKSIYYTADANRHQHQPITKGIYATTIEDEETDKRNNGPWPMLSNWRNRPFDNRNDYARAWISWIDDHHNPRMNRRDNNNNPTPHSFWVRAALDGMRREHTQTKRLTIRRLQSYWQKFEALIQNSPAGQHRHIVEPNFLFNLSSKIHRNNYHNRNNFIQSAKVAFTRNSRARGNPRVTDISGAFFNQEHGSENINIESTRPLKEDPNYRQNQPVSPFISNEAAVIPNQVPTVIAPAQLGPAPNFPAIPYGGHAAPYGGPPDQLGPGVMLHDPEPFINIPNIVKGDFSSLMKPKVIISGAVVVGLYYIVPVIPWEQILGWSLGGVASVTFLAGMYQTLKPAYGGGKDSESKSDSSNIINDDVIKVLFSSIAQILENKGINNVKLDCSTKLINNDLMTISSSVINDGTNLDEQAGIQFNNLIEKFSNVFSSDEIESLPTSQNYNQEDWTAFNDQLVGGAGGESKSKSQNQSQTTTVDDEDTVAKVKKDIREKIGIPPDQQRLTFPPSSATDSSPGEPPYGSTTKLDSISNKLEIEISNEEYLVSQIFNNRDLKDVIRDFQPVKEEEEGYNTSNFDKLMQYRNGENSINDTESKELMAESEEPMAESEKLMTESKGSMTESEESNIPSLSAIISSDKDGAFHKTENGKIRYQNSAYKLEISIDESSKKITFKCLINSEFIRKIFRKIVIQNFKLIERIFGKKLKNIDDEQYISGFVETCLSIDTNYNLERKNNPNYKPYDLNDFLATDQKVIGFATDYNDKDFIWKNTNFYSNTTETEDGTEVSLYDPLLFLKLGNSQIKKFRDALAYHKFASDPKNKDKLHDEWGITVLSDKWGSAPECKRDADCNYRGSCQKRTLNTKDGKYAVSKSGTCVINTEISNNEFKEMFFKYTTEETTPELNMSFTSEPPVTRSEITDQEMEDLIFEGSFKSLSQGDIPEQEIPSESSMFSQFRDWMFPPEAPTNPDELTSYTEGAPGGMYYDSELDENMVSYGMGGGRKKTKKNKRKKKLTRKKRQKHTKFTKRIKRKHRYTRNK